MSKLRDLCEVIDQMIAVIPTNEPIIEALGSCRSSAEFSAPELMITRWYDTADCLYGYMGDIPDEGWDDWRGKVVAIWQNK